MWQHEYCEQLSIVNEESSVCDWRGYAELKKGRLLEHTNTLQKEPPKPTWDGFRCLALKDGDRIELRSKSGKS